MTDPDVIDGLIARLEAQCPELVSVQEAWFAAPLDRLNDELPAAMPYLAEDGAEGEVETTRPRQRITLSYGIWLVCKKPEFRPQRQAIRKALFGHEFSSAHEPMAYRGGQTVDIRGELIWWREFWTVDTWLRQ